MALSPNVNNTTDVDPSRYRDRMLPDSATLRSLHDADALAARWGGGLTARNGCLAALIA